MEWEIGTFKKEYENLKSQIEEYQDFWEWYEKVYGKTKADLFDEWELSTNQKPTHRCLLKPYGTVEMKCTKCGYVTWRDDSKTTQELIDQMLEEGYPLPICSSPDKL